MCACPCLLIINKTQREVPIKNCKTAPHTKQIAEVMPKRKHENLKEPPQQERQIR
jgi:hypothetical protein